MLFEPQTIRVIACMACLHPRTVKRFFDRKPLRRGNAHRIRVALRDLGIEKPENDDG